MKVIQAIVLTLCCLALTHCGPATGGTETGNTQSVSIRLIGYQSSLYGSMAALTVGDLEVIDAQIVLDRLKFLPFSACDSTEGEGGEEIRIEGSFPVDLLHPEILSGLENIGIPTGRYCKIQLRFEKLESSIFLAGSRSDGMPFQMTASIDEEFELQNQTTGILIEATSLRSVFFIAFDLDRWFDGVDLYDPSIETFTDSQGDSIILLDEVRNASFQEKIVENIKNSPNLFEDQNDNNHLDDEEEADSISE